MPKVGDKPQIGENMINYFKPMLAANFGVGVEPDWNLLLNKPKEWLISEKLDGIRIGIWSGGKSTSRSLKPIDSVHIRHMAEATGKSMKLRGIMEAEIWSPNMNLEEIKHFCKSKDVTSAQSVSKYEKLWKKTKGQAKWVTDEKGTRNEGWKYPGRDVAWATTWPTDLQFWVFDMFYQDMQDLGKEDRIKRLVPENFGKRTHLNVLSHAKYDTLEEIKKDYDELIEKGGEGMMVVHKDQKYQFGRRSLLNGLVYKMKNDKVRYEAVITDLKEGTQSIEGTPKTHNELGRSKTSQLQEHREPSGICSAFLVEMDDGTVTKVSLNGFTTPEKRELFAHKEVLIGTRIHFLGMPPSKEGGRPRNASATKGNMIVR
tara:strand:+ start:8436 stop:9551 length:1116 start_codon:yes stop_codon:yes gene_type:complete